MAFRLPPLNALRLFEAAGRHLSFKLAAQELGVTPSAVSHAVQGLEDWLGTPLFARSSRGLTLTEAGASYLPAVRDALTLLASAGERLPGRRPAEHIRISVSPTFGARILLPTLSQFRERHPGMTVYIDTTHQQVQFPQDGADLAIRLGTGAWPGLDGECLLYEDLVPVCAPAIRERHSAIEAFQELSLIHVTTVTHDWSTWLASVGLSAAESSHGLRVDTIQMALDAATRGMGVALGRRPLVDPELAVGALVPFIDKPVRSPTAYWLVGLPEMMERAEINAFRSWLKEELSVYGTNAAN